MVPMPGAPTAALGSDFDMTLYLDPKKTISLRQREAGGFRSCKNTAMEVEAEREQTITRCEMGWKEYVAGYGGLFGYLGLTQVLGLNFFQLEPENRAYWLLGAVVVLGLVTLRGRHSPASRQ